MDRKARKAIGRAILALCLVAACVAPATRAQDSLDKLATDFWAWRAETAPFNNDDIPRMERPANLKQSWSAASLSKQRTDLAAFESRYKKMDATKWQVPQQVDYRLIGSALARVRWELDYNKRYQSDPTFYVDQAMGPVVQAILPIPPFDKTRSGNLIASVQNVPSVVTDAEANLQKPCAPFAKLAIESLTDIRTQLWEMAHEVTPQLQGANLQELSPAVERAAASLENYREWLKQRVATMPPCSPVGRDAYTFFLKNVALYPYSPDQLLEMANQEWARAVSAEEIERQRNSEIPVLKPFASLDEQLQATINLENAVRHFLTRQGLLTVPLDMPHYTSKPIPTYLQGLGSFAELDDFTGPSRLTQDAVRWTEKPSLNPGYFEGATQRDPRPLVVHEGVPGHYMQLWLSWKNPDPIRRHYYDSGVNEGLGFYAEEMMLLAGLFDDSPHSREIIYNFMRLRALRVDVDVKLALGQMNNEQAAAYLAKAVPMNPKTSQFEAAMFSTQPGQAISYQTGKIQIMKFLADARIKASDKFDLRAFHDFVWSNGNVPIELQRAEWFGDSAVAPAAAVTKTSSTNTHSNDESVPKKKTPAAAPKPN
ncbi:MAG TPA: DUF885 family protein [Candidatus Sulfotelmatobacter sp.]|nr:DUF885 family protein [Candidatus Sulfotelmatobacter sp.]